MVPVAEESDRKKNSDLNDLALLGDDLGTPVQSIQPEQSSPLSNASRFGPQISNQGAAVTSRFQGIFDIEKWCLPPLSLRTGIRREPSLEFIPSAHTAAEYKCPSVGCNNYHAVFIAHLCDALVNAERF
jgi:hypothetical protein